MFRLLRRILAKPRTPRRDCEQRRPLPQPQYILRAVPLPCSRRGFGFSTSPPYRDAAGLLPLAFASRTMPFRHSGARLLWRRARPNASSTMGARCDFASIEACTVRRLTIARYDHLSVLPGPPIWAGHHTNLQFPKGYGLGQYAFVGAIGLLTRGLSPASPPAARRRSTRRQFTNRHPKALRSIGLRRSTPLGRASA